MEIIETMMIDTINLVAGMGIISGACMVIFLLLYIKDYNDEKKNGDR